MYGGQVPKTSLNAKMSDKKKCWKTEFMMQYKKNWCQQMKTKAQECQEWRAHKGY